MFNGKKLAQLRKQRNLSQEQLAKKINVSLSSVAMYETNKRQPDDETKKAISQLFGVSIDYLLDNEVNKEFKEQTEENQELLKNISEELQDPTMKALYSKASELKNDRDRKMVLNVIKGFMDDVDNNEQ